jgi:hypothetical protein
MFIEVWLMGCTIPKFHGFREQGRVPGGLTVIDD